MSRLALGPDQLNVEEPRRWLFSDPDDVLLLTELEEFQPRFISIAAHTVEDCYAHARFLNQEVSQVFRSQVGLDFRFQSGPVALAFTVTERTFVIAVFAVVYVVVHLILDYVIVAWKLPFSLIQIRTAKQSHRFVPWGFHDILIKAQTAIAGPGYDASQLLLTWHWNCTQKLRLYSNITTSSTVLPNHLPRSVDYTFHSEWTRLSLMVNSSRCRASCQRRMTPSIGHQRLDSDAPMVGRGSDCIEHRQMNQV